jgi:hypothetical protein
MRRRAAALGAAALAAAALGAAVARAADAPAVPLAPVARSALSILEAGTAPAGIVLRLRRAQDQAPLAVTELSVAVDGRSQPALRQADGTWLVPLARPAGAPRLEVSAAHDGIREVLTAQLAPPATPAASSAPLSGARKQLAWWILNIAVVLIAAIAISRRVS